MTQTTNGTIQTGDSTLYYEKAGAGPALVLLHADVADRRMWDDLWQPLAQHFTVIRYDRPGFGESAPVESIESHTAELARLLDTLGIAQAHLLGCSRGGEILLDFALAYPERVLSLMPISATPGGFAFQGEMPAMMAEMFGAYQQGDMPAAAEWMNRLNLAGERRTREDIAPALWQRVIDMNTPALMNHAWEIPERTPLTPPAATRLGEIRVPVLAVGGAFDNPEIARAAHVIADGVADGEAWIVDGAAHLLPMEVPAALAERVVRFIKSSV